MRNTKATDHYEYMKLVENFVYQKGDKGAKLISILSRYISSQGYKNYPLSIEDQQDVLQEVCIKILNNHKKIKNNCRSWLLKVTYNEYIDKIRKNVKPRDIITLDTSSQIVSVDRKSIGISKMYDDVEDMMDCIDYIFHCFSNSKNYQKDDKSIFIQHLSNISNTDIANNLNRTKAAIEKRLSKLKKRFRELATKHC